MAPQQRHSASDSSRGSGRRGALAPRPADGSEPCAPSLLMPRPLVLLLALLLLLLLLLLRTCRAGLPLTAGEARWKGRPPWPLALSAVGGRAGSATGGRAWQGSSGTFDATHNLYITCRASSHVGGLPRKFSEIISAAFCA
jgi:hypothetical protein